MKKRLIRYPVTWGKLFFKKNNKVIFVDWKTVSKKYKIHDVIKLTKLDYKNLNKNKKKITHFNIQYTVHRPGKNYLIVKIEKPGYFNGKVNKPPILNLNSFILTKCILAKNNIKYDKIKKIFFDNSFKNITNTPTLKLAIKRRYKKSLAHLTDLEKLSLGVAITKLKIIKKFSKII